MKILPFKMIKLPELAKCCHFSRVYEVWLKTLNLDTLAYFMQIVNGKILKK